MKPSRFGSGRGSSWADWCSSSSWRRRSSSFDHRAPCAAPLRRWRLGRERRSYDRGKSSSTRKAGLSRNSAHHISRREAGNRSTAFLGHRPSQCNVKHRGSHMDRKEYAKALRTLQVELCTLQDWIKGQGLRVVVVFEGRDAAGKGGAIKAITDRVSPRVFRVVAL